ncbi:MAG: hypothetical protein KJZ83_23170, partial [Burkholderiaceae bacterium]|nr:hypothetical protein [Burkholderiaceae bacterium]
MDETRRRAWSALELGPLWRLRDHGRSASAIEAGEDEAQAAPPAGAAALAQDLGRLREQVASCRACGLCESRTQTVFGVGPDRARWMVLGEAPGAEEDARGEPIVGQAG